MNGIVGSSRSRWIAGALLGAAALILPAIAGGVQARSAPAPKPASGGTLVMPNPGGQPDCLDPQKTGLSASNFIDNLVFDSLASEDEKGRIRPDLALKWKFSNGGKVGTFYLRHDVHFSNGDLFTASAVKYTFDRALATGTKSPASASELASISKTVVVNPYTVKLILKTPSRPLLTNLVGGYTGILDPKVTQSQGSATCQDPIGTGAFKIASSTAAFNTITLVRNNLHNWEVPWANNPGRAYLSKIVVKTIISEATQVSELLAHQVDLSLVGGTQLDRVKGNSSIKLYYTPATGETFLGFNTTSPPFNQIAVRRAVAEAIDRGAVIKASLNGLGKPVYSALPPTILDGLPTKLAKTYAPGFDPADAQRLITAAHATGPYNLIFPQDPEVSAAAELIQGELGQIGMKVNVEGKPIGDYLSAAGAGKFDMNLLGYGYSDPDILYLIFDSSQGKGAGLDFTNYVNPTLDNLLAEGRVTLNQRKARAIYYSAQRLMARQVVVDPLFLSTEPQAVSKRVHGWRTGVAGALYSDLYLNSK